MRLNCWRGHKCTAWLVHKAWVKWKKTKNISDYELFSLFRHRYKLESKKCFVDYIESVENGIRTNIKNFWSFISSRKCNPGIPSTVRYKNDTTSDPKEICNYFSAFFESVYEPSSSDLSNWDVGLDPHKFDNHSTVNLSSIHLSCDSILRELKNLDATKGPGPDGIPASFLKATSVSITMPLYIIFNKCLHEGSFPAVWKTANITPVFKSGSRSNVEDYRPISGLSALSKLFEKLVHTHIYPLLHSNIIQQQHGFVHRRSTVTNLMLYSNYLFDHMDHRI